MYKRYVGDLDMQYMPVKLCIYVYLYKRYVKLCQEGNYAVYAYVYICICIRGM